MAVARPAVLAAVQQTGRRALEYAAGPLRADHDIVLTALQQNGRALQWAAKPLVSIANIKGRLSSALDLCEAQFQPRRQAFTMAAKVLAEPFAGDGDPWACALALTTEDGAAAGCVRAVRAGEETLLTAFGREALSAESRAKFECFPWMSDALSGELTAAIAANAARRDLHLLALDAAGAPVGYVFLWAASDDVPELGLAVADAWHGRGLGSQLLRVVAEMGRALSKQALELTTMQGNDRALFVYKRAGWEHLGVIHNPLGCDVPAAFRGEATPTGVAVENHCVLVLDEARRGETLAMLDAKRERATSLFPVPEGGLDEKGVYRAPPGPRSNDAEATAEPVQ